MSAPPADGEEMSISRVGQDLYEKIFKPYTKKQWDKWPKELDASVLARLPVRLVYSFPVGLFPVILFYKLPVEQL